MKRSRVIIALFTLLFYGGSYQLTASAARGAEPRPWPQTQQTRESIAQTVKPGMTRRDVEDILDRRSPGDDFYWNDASSQGDKCDLRRYQLNDGLYLIVEYLNLPLRFKLSPDDKVSAVKTIHFGDLKTQLPDSLRPYLLLVHDSPSLGASNFNPIPLIKAVNGLRSLGKDKALLVLREYLRLADPDPENEDQEFQYNLDRDRLFYIAHLLFVRREGQLEGPVMSWMPIGREIIPSVNSANETWPLWPLVIQDDVPFDMAETPFGGNWASPADDLTYSEQSCALRDFPLVPKTSPLRAAQSIMNSQRWKTFFKDRKQEDVDRSQEFLRAEAVRSIHGLLREDFFFEGQSSAVSDKLWETTLDDDRVKNLIWNIKDQQYAISGSPKAAEPFRR